MNLKYTLLASALALPLILGFQSTGAQASEHTNSINGSLAKAPEYMLGIGVGMEASIDSGAKCTNSDKNVVKVDCKNGEVKGLSKGSATVKVYDDVRELIAVYYIKVN
ncbi:Ig-like domain-containing protein [Paenibacillus elgii]|uniref:Ig-like domain-containing protein n=1 Tax=Paenibacillus elgii TaxID=189691 RepID=UPI0013D8BE18|nr:Ig-like domain-containing protein [Paenibacillus elgii]